MSALKKDLMSLRKIEETPFPCAGPAQQIGVEADRMLVVDFDADAFEGEFFFILGDDGVREEGAVVHGGAGGGFGSSGEAEGDEAECDEAAGHW